MARRAAQKHIPIALRRELWITLTWTALLFIALFFASLGLTWMPAGASAGSLIAAAWHYVGVVLLLGGTVAFFVGALFDVIRAGRGQGPWSEDVPLWHPALVLAAPAACILRSTTAGYISPETWTFIAATPAIGHCVALLARYLAQAPLPRPITAVGALALGAIGLAGAADLAPSPSIPTLGKQFSIDHSLAHVVPLKPCRHIPITNEQPLLRDSLHGEIHCITPSFTGIFYAFRNGALLQLYASQRAAKARKSSGSPASRCQETDGTFIGNWHATNEPRSELGSLLCYTSGGVATIEWSDMRDNVYSLVRHPSRAGLYSWWHSHSTWELPPGNGTSSAARQLSRTSSGTQIGP